MVIKEIEKGRLIQDRIWGGQGDGVWPGEGERNQGPVLNFCHERPDGLGCSLLTWEVGTGEGTFLGSGLERVYFGCA